MSNGNVTPNTAGLIRLVRAELEAAKKKDQPDHCASCPFASCTDCKYQPDHDLTRGNQ